MTFLRKSYCYVAVRGYYSDNLTETEIVALQGHIFNKIEALEH